MDTSARSPANSTEAARLLGDTAATAAGLFAARTLLVPAVWSLPVAMEVEPATYTPFRESAALKPHPNAQVEPSFCSLFNDEQAWNLHANGALKGHRLYTRERFPESAWRAWVHVCAVCEAGCLLTPLLDPDRHPLFPPTDGAPYFYDVDQGPKQSLATKLLGTRGTDRTVCRGRRRSQFSAPADTQFSRNHTSWGIAPRFQPVRFPIVACMLHVCVPFTWGVRPTATHHVWRRAGARHIQPEGQHLRPVPTHVTCRHARLPPAPAHIIRSLSQRRVAARWSGKAHDRPRARRRQRQGIAAAHLYQPWRWRHTQQAGDVTAVWATTDAGGAAGHDPAVPTPAQHAADAACGEAACGPRERASHWCCGRVQSGACRGCLCGRV